MNDLNTAHRARITLAAINRALTPIGYDAFPGPDLDALPDVSAPTDQEIHDAITKVKGDVGKSAEIQALAARAWLASTGTAKGLEHGAWVTAWETCRAALPAISDEIRGKYAGVADRLREAATGAFRGTADLKTLDLHSLPTPLAKQAGAVVEDYRVAVALHGAWRAIWAALHEGAPSHWAEVARPTQAQYTHARDSKPQQWPSADPWSVASKDWEGDLPESLKAARERRAAYMHTAKDAEDQRRAEGARRGMVGGFGVSLL
ncbi:hypothetical protein ACTXJ9_14090 [Brachybacterium tyrofermentans]|uniref:hypothetical protein n=1 Tax=Brachybacterium tyrofermentans TaxID=47848 RepID=UPI003FD4D8A0